MTVEIRRTLTPSEQELEVEIQGLIEALAAVPEDLRPALAPTHEPLNSLGEALEAEDPQACLSSLIALARALHDILKANPTGPLSSLPVPSYDLWLPFKADSSRTSEDPAFDPYRVLAISVRNCRPKKIWTILESYGFKKKERLYHQPPSHDQEEEDQR